MPRWKLYRLMFAMLVVRPAASLPAIAEDAIAVAPQQADGFTAKGESSEAAAIAADGQFAAGDVVEVEWRGQWYAAKVLSVAGDRRWKITYEGYSDSYDETVGIERIRRLQRAADSKSSSRVAPEKLVWPSRDYSYSDDLTVYSPLNNSMPMAIAPDGESLVVAIDSGDDGPVECARRIDLRSGMEICRFVIDGHRVSSAAISLDGRLAATSSTWTHDLCLWDAKTGETLFRFRHPQSKAIGGLSFSPDGKWLAASMATVRDGPFIVELFDVKTGRLVRTLQFGFDDFQHVLHTLRFTADGRTLFAAGTGGVFVVDVDSSRGRMLFPYNQGLKWTYAVALSPDERQLATAHYHDVVVWDVATGQEIRRFSFNQDERTASDPSFATVPEFKFVQYLDPQRLLAVGDAAREPRSFILDLKGGGALSSLPIQSGPQMQESHLSGAGAVSADGSRFIEANDRGVMIWNLEANVPEACIRLAIQPRQWYVETPVDAAGKAVIAGSPRAVEALATDSKGQSVQRIQSHGVIKRILAGMSREDAERLPADAAPPQLSISVESVQSGRAELRLSPVVDSRTAVAAVIVAVDGVDVAVSHPASGREEYRATIEFPPGRNQVHVKAAMTDKWGQRSPWQEFPLARAKPVKGATGRMYVLAIGVGDYEFDEYDLQFPAADVRAIAQALADQQGLSFADVQLQLLTDGEATLPQVKAGLQWLQRGCTPADMAVVVFAGHGLKGRRGLYYMTHEGDAQSVQATCLNWQDIVDAMKNTKARRILFLADACYAGAFAASDLPSQVEVAQSLVAASNITVLASCEAGEVAVESEAWGHGAFSKTLLGGLDGSADADGDGKITIAELCDYVKQETAALTADQQHPTVVKSDGDDGLLVITRTMDADDLEASAETAPLRQATMLADQPIMISDQRLGMATRGMSFVILRTRDEWIYGRFPLPGGAIEGWVSAAGVRSEQ